MFTKANPAFRNIAVCKHLSICHSGCNGFKFPCKSLHYFSRMNTSRNLSDAQEMFLPGSQIREFSGYELPDVFKHNLCGAFFVGHIFFTYRRCFRQAGRLCQQHGHFICQARVTVDGKSPVQFYKV